MRPCVQTTALLKTNKQTKPTTPPQKNLNDHFQGDPVTGIAVLFYI
jgi:hypothetical protein